MNMKEIEKKLKDIENKKRKLEEEERELYLAKSNIQQEKLSCLVGKYFKQKDSDNTDCEYIYVYKVPPIETDIYGHRHFNQYQIPVLRLSNYIDDLIGSALIQEDTEPSMCVDYDNVLEKFSEHWEEISKEQFDHEVRSRLDWIYQEYRDF